MTVDFSFQKQYIFLYRALLDVAQFGNTEIALKDLNTTVEQLKQRSNDSRDQCKLEMEFEVSSNDHLHIERFFKEYFYNIFVVFIENQFAFGRNE